MDKQLAEEEEIVTAGKVIKIDELDIGEFHPDADEEADKNKEKLFKVEKSIKEAKDLMRKLEEQKKDFIALEKEVLELLESEAKLNNIIVSDDNH